MGTYKREGLQGSKRVDLTYVVPMAGQEAGDISPPTARGSDMSWLQVDMRRRSGARHCWLVYGREDARRRMVKTRNQCNKADGVDLVRWFDASCVSMLAAAAAAGDQYQSSKSRRAVSYPVLSQTSWLVFNGASFLPACTTCLPSMVAQFLPALWSHKCERKPTNREPLNLT